MLACLCLDLCRFNGFSAVNLQRFVNALALLQ
jgi:hypothetical protein